MPGSGRQRAGPLPPSWLHALLMIYGFFPFFISAF